MSDLGVVDVQEFTVLRFFFLLLPPSFLRAGEEGQKEGRIALEFVCCNAL